MDLKEIAKKANELEQEIGVNIDDILNKLTQELGEFNDAIQKHRGIYCREKNDSLDHIKEEAGDLMVNFISILYRMGINPDEIPLYAENTIKKFIERKELYLKNKKCQ